MGKDNPPAHEAYNQIQSFLETIKADADIKTKIAVMDKVLETFLTKDKINEMIWDAIKDHDANIEKINKNRIQWGPIIQSVVIAVVIAAITAFVIKGMA